MVERLKREHDVQVEWKPFFLHPETPPDGFTLPPQLKARFATANGRLDQMAQAAGMTMVHPDFIPNSRRALEATEYARDQSKELEFHRVVFRQYYAQGQNIHDWNILRAAAKEAGLDPDEMQQETERGTYREAVDAQIAEAHELGITGVPTYILNDKYAIVGAQPYEVFQRVLTRLEREANGDEATGPDKG